MKRHLNQKAGLIGMVSLIAALSLASFAPARAQSDSYFEGFDNEALGWKATEAWLTSDGLFLGRGAGDAIYAERTWDRMRFATTLRSMTGTLDIRFHHDGGSQAYAVRLTTQANSLIVELARSTFSEDTQTLGKAELFVNQGDLQEQGLTIEATFDKGAITVAGNGETVIEAFDEAPLPGGYIGFQTFDQSFVAVDSVSVTPLEAETQKGVDLAVQGVRVERFEQGSVIVVVAVDVANLGFTPSPAFELLIGDSQAGNFNNSALISPLAGGEQRTITLSLEGPDDWQDTERRFVVELDPSNALDEANRDNNRFETEPMLVPNLSGGEPLPGPDSQPGAQPSPTPSLLLIGGIVVVLGGMAAVAIATGLAVRQQLKIGQRRKWEKQAQQGRPPERCGPPGYYVEVAPSMNLKPMRVTRITLTATDTGRESVRRRQDIKGSAANTLKLAIVGRWLGDPDHSLAARIGDVSSEMGKTVSEFLIRETGRCDVRINAHLEGIEVKATFTLYRCVKQGADGVWKKVDSWEKSRAQARDDSVALLADRDPQATHLPGGFAAELEPLIRQYVEGYRIQ